MIRMTAAISAAIFAAGVANADPVQLSETQMDRVTAGDAASLLNAAANTGALTPVFLVDAGDGGQVRVVDDPAARQTGLDAPSLTPAE